MRGLKRKRVAVIGLGRFGTNVALTLTELGCKVLAVDSEMENINKIAALVDKAIQADVTKEECLAELGLEQYDAVVLTIGSNLQASIMTALGLKNLGVLKTVAKASSELHKKALEKVGVDHVVFPEKDSAIKLAHSLMSVNLVEYLEISPNLQIAEIIIQGKYHGQTLKETGIRNKHNLNVLAIRNKDKINSSPQADHVLHKGDRLIILGSSQDLKEFSDNC
ncbi:MAG: TrkA family potassium uptake protein [Bacillota bacterium]